MSRHLAHPMHVIPSKKMSSRQQRVAAKREVLKTEIMGFAGRVRFNIRLGTNVEFLKRMSSFTQYAALGELRAYKKGIQRGEKSEEYPVAEILKKRGDSAKEIAAFLGPDYFDRFARILGGPNNVRERGLAEAALKWAFEYGDQNLSARALGGIAKGAAREAEGCNDGMRSKKYVERNGQMGFLSGAVGSKLAWRVVNRINEVGENFRSWVMGASFLSGAIIAGITRIFSEGFASNGFLFGSLGLIGGSIVVAAAVMGKLANTSLWGLGKTFKKERERLLADEHL